MGKAGEQMSQGAMGTQVTTMQGGSASHGRVGLSGRVDDLVLTCVLPVVALSPYLLCT